MHACMHAAEWCSAAAGPALQGRRAPLQPLALPGQERARARRRTGVQRTRASAMPAMRCLACHGLLFLSIYMATYIPSRLSLSTRLTT